jgi:hypothetical protein
VSCGSTFASYAAVSNGITTLRIELTRIPHRQSPLYSVPNEGLQQPNEIAGRGFHGGHFRG